MVLGFIIYESIDIAYNIGKISYNGVTGLYNWYYDIKSEEKQELERLDKLEDKLDKLTKLFETENVKQKIEQLKLKN
tara:strand:- start:86 stop:316 length:231 start_codon:yes stop_codon:yes gene_type:complete